MAKTLRDLIEDNDFAGYKVTEDYWSISASDVEFAIYGFTSGAASGDEDPLEIIAKEYGLDLIEIATWLDRFKTVGLQILRLSGEPVAIVWQQGCKSECTIHFVSERAHQRFRSVWEAAVKRIDITPKVLRKEYLDMPIAAAGSPYYDIDSEEGEPPELTEGGIKTWLKDIGGLNKTTSIPTLRTVYKTIHDTWEFRKKNNAELHEMAAKRGINAKQQLLAVDQELEAITALKDDIKNRLEELE